MEQPILVRYKTKTDGVTRYYLAKNLQKAREAAKELAKYKNLFTGIYICL